MINDDNSSLICELSSLAEAFEPPSRAATLFRFYTRWAPFF